MIWNSRIFYLILFICLAISFGLFLIVFSWWISCDIWLFKFNAISEKDKIVLIFNQIVDVLHDLALAYWDLNELPDSAAQK